MDNADGDSAFDADSWCWRIEAAEEGEGERRNSESYLKYVRITSALKSVPRLVRGRCNGMVSLAMASCTDKRSCKCLCSLSCNCSTALNS